MPTEAIALLVLALPHVIGAAFLAWWILPDSAKDELRGWFRDEGDGGDPGGTPATPHGGGGSRLPLPNASPAAVRMREPGRLTDQAPIPARRPHQPAEPERRRERLPG